jgi:hypothetical protein
MALTPLANSRSDRGFHSIHVDVAVIAAQSRITN